MFEGAGGMSDRQSITNARQTRSRLLEGKVAIITGASRGIGATAARVFAQAGARLVLAARSEDNLKLVVEDINANGGEAIAVPTDVAEAASVENLVRRAADSFGRLDVAFNNAGT